jgi:hypothetical protein
VEAIGALDDNHETKQIAQLMKSKRSTMGSVGDPDPKKLLKPGFWNKHSINCKSPKQVKALINDKALSKDQEACQNILNNIV